MFNIHTSPICGGKAHRHSLKASCTLADTDGYTASLLLAGTRFQALDAKTTLHKRKARQVSSTKVLHLMCHQLEAACEARCLPLAGDSPEDTRQGSAISLLLSSMNQSVPCRMSTERAKLEIELQSTKADASRAMLQGDLISAGRYQLHAQYLEMLIRRPYRLPASTGDRPDKTPNWGENLE